jgi:hypothetical protein
MWLQSAIELIEHDAAFYLAPLTGWINAADFAQRRGVDENAAFCGDRSPGKRCSRSANGDRRLQLSTVPDQINEFVDIGRDNNGIGAELFVAQSISVIAGELCR